MEISNLGEFGLIRRLTQDIELKNTETLKGVGDDCAILNYGGERDVLVTTDMLMEGVHFDRVYMPMKHLGYKAAQVNFSDIYAMGGTPRQITVSMAMARLTKVEDVEQFYEGLRLACDAHGVDIVGGDTCSSRTGLAISITCIGDVEHGRAVMRSGARPTDLICVSGDLGAAYMGLQLLEREKTVYFEQISDINKRLTEADEAGDKARFDAVNEELKRLNFQPDFAGREYLLERQMRPEARRDIVVKLREAGIRPTAMMDVSDGLSSELLHICNDSGVGCRVYEERLPIDYQTAVMAEELNMNVSTCALNGGEDYELLFTVPIADHEKIEAMDGVRLIGHITEPSLGAALVTRDGGEFELKAQGWQAFSEH